jgi:hypothetical protein
MENSNSKLFKLLISLSPKEFSCLGKFLSSPFYNRSSSVIKLYTLLKKYHPCYYSKTLTNEYIHKTDFGSGRYNEGSVKNLYTQMLNLTLEYLSAASLKNDKLLQIEILLPELNKKKHDLLYRQSLKSAKDLLNDKSVREETYHVHKKYIDERELYFEMTRSPLGKHKKYTGRNKNSVKHLLFAHYIMMFQEFILYLNSGLSDKEDTFFISYFTNLIKNYNGSSGSFAHPVLDVYSSFVSIFSSLNRSQFLKLKDLVIKSKDILKEDSYKFLMQMLIEYCKHNDSDENGFFNDQCCSLLNKLLEDNLIKGEDGMMLGSDYIDIAVYYLLQNNIVHAEKFIESFKTIIYPSQAEDSYRFCLGVLNYYKGKNADIGEEIFYRKSLTNLFKVKTHYYEYRLKIFDLTVKIYYELNMSQPLILLIDSFKHYLKANVNSIPLDYLERYFNFIKYVLTLMKHKKSRKNPQIEKTRQEVLNIKSLENRKWLIKQLQILKIVY